MPYFLLIHLGIAVSSFWIDYSFRFHFLFLPPSIIEKTFLLYIYTSIASHHRSRYLFPISFRLSLAILYALLPLVVHYPPHRLQ